MYKDAPAVDSAYQDSPTAGAMDAPAHAAAPALTVTHKCLLLRVARQTLHIYLTRGDLPHFASDDPVLQAPRAVFVTLRTRVDGDLRGCRGECTARRPLIQAVAHMAVASAVDDPRFAPLPLAELPEIKIEISALTPLTPIAPADVEVGRHGLLIISGKHTGLLLPQVPALFGWDREEFLAALCAKAGLRANTWRAPGVELYSFEAEHWGEED